MANSDRLRELAVRTLGELDRASDYYYHTQAAWRLVQGVVAEGRTVGVENMDTRRSIEGPALAGLGQGYVTGYLAESVFQHYISLFEDFTFELIRCWLIAHPEGITGLDNDGGDERLKVGDKTVPLSFVIDNPDRDGILRAVIDRELDRLKYKRIAVWFQYLDRRVRLGTPSEDQIGRLAEIKASRDILAHSGGIVNAIYLSKSGSGARYAEGTRLKITEPYLRGSWLLITDVVREMSSSAITKLEKSQAAGGTEPPAT